MEYRFSEKNQDFSEKIEISYDVERPAVGGDIIIRDGYFVHFIGSDDIPEKNKTVIFVIDRSGSMAGDRIEKVKQAYSVSEHFYFELLLFHQACDSLQNFCSWSPHMRF